MHSVEQINHLDLWDIIEKIGAVVAILTPIATATIFFIKKRKIRRYYEIIWKRSSKLEPKDILGTRASEKLNYYDYYEIRQEDHLIKSNIEKGEEILITGNPLAGKTRAVYNVLKNLDETVDVIVPRIIDIKASEFKIPKRVFSRRRRFVVFDDIDRFATQETFSYMLNEYYKNGIKIIATCQLGEPYKVLKSKSEREKYPQFLEEIEIVKPSLDFAKKVAMNTIGKLPEAFDGNIGSIFLPLETMTERFNNSTLEEKIVLLSIGRLYGTGIFVGKEFFSKERIKKVCIEWKDLNKKKYEWDNIFENLQNNGFFQISGERIQIEKAYLNSFIEKKDSLEDFRDMLKIFKGDPEALYLLGSRSTDIGRIYIDNTIFFINFAIEAFNNALTDWNEKENPHKYGRIQNNLGVSYRRLSEVSELEHKEENINKAIEAFNKALDVWTKNKYPEDYATAKMNLGIAYGTLSEVEKKPENAKLAINTFKEVLELRTINRFPMQYANTQMNMGNAYTILSDTDHENKKENAKNAISAHEEAFKIFTPDHFPMEYYLTNMNLGNAYLTLYKIEYKKKNLKTAIKCYEKSLEFFNLNRYPTRYATTQINIGTAYGMLSEEEEPYENTMKELKAYDEALRIHTKNKFPIQYQQIMHNKNIALARLNRLEEEGKAKK